ncbi:hypothetical protein [Desulfomarina sp.]
MEKKIKITYYRSKLCPRCFLAGKYLRAIIGEDRNIDVEEVDIMSSPLRFMETGIRMIPALVIGKETLSSIYLNRKSIEDFISRHKEKLRRP